MKKYLLGSSVMFGMFFVLSFLVSSHQVVAAGSSITALQTVANHSTVNDQTDVTTPTAANVAETKASRTIGVAALPGNAESITIGSCVVSFTTIASSTTDELNCNDNTASIDRTLSTGDTLRTTAQIATSLQSLTNASSTGTHGALTVASGGTATTTIFTTTATETSATAITFTDGTGGDIVNISSTLGVVPVAQINTVTIAGTVETGDVFTVNLPTVGNVSYTVLAGATTNALIASGLQGAILASSGYSSQAFTSATSTNTVVLTAKVAGTGFTQTSTTTNLAATAQVVTFTPSDVERGAGFTVTINATDYTYRAELSTVKNVVEGLKSVLDSESSVTCSEDDLVLTCTSATPGTSFTYDAAITHAASSGSSGGGSHHSSSTGGDSTTTVVSSSDTGCTGGAVFNVSTGARCNTASDTGCTTGALFSTMTGARCSTSVSITAPKFIFNQNLNVGMTNEDVRQLQLRLTSEGVYSGPITGYFGPLTLAGVKLYQTRHGISSIGLVGPLTRASLNQ